MVPTNAPTRYEVAVFNKDGRKLVLGYTARKSRYGIDAYFTAENGKRIGDFTALPLDSVWKIKRGAWICGTWTIGFTGRTERDVKNAPDITIMTGATA